MLQFDTHFTYRKLLRYTFSPIIMSIFASIYGVVDGFFVSNYAGKIPFSAVNFVWPLLGILCCCGYMFGSGASALIGKTLGEGDHKKANEIFSMLIYVSFIIGVLLATAGILLIRPFVEAFGIEGELLDCCIIYGRIFLLSLPFMILQIEFQCLFATAGKAHLGLLVTVAAGVTNMVLDALLVAVIPWGIYGAAVATAISQVLGGVIPLFYFFRRNKSLLRLVRAPFDGRALWRISTNGSSELLSNVSMSLVSMLYNMQLLKYAGENGLAAYGVLMYLSMIFMAIFWGYAMGVIPMISFHYGAGNHREVRSLLIKSLTIIGVTSVVMAVSGEVLAWPLSKLYVGYEPALFELTIRGFRLFSLSFLFSGVCIFASSFFTALNNGLVSAVISILRTLVFQIAAILILPLIWEIDGIWSSFAVGEAAAAVVVAIFLAANKRKYQY